MPERKKMLPIGIDNFEKLRTNDFYYVDKTGLLIDLLNSWCEVTLFTRPRRFGKSLNISMLEAFFSPDSDKRVFNGLKIAGEKELCEKYMGKHPVIAVSLKGVNASNFNTAYRMTADIIREAAVKVDGEVSGSERLGVYEKADLAKLLDGEMDEAALYGSLYTLSRILKKHYGRDVIILIDEYDVPLANAYEQGYYDQMVLLIRNLFEKALKSNDSLKFAVLTGCMRISKESIFTGLNNMQVRSVSDEEYDEHFGFTDAEVREILRYYGFPEYYQTVKDWYDGYRFGRTAIYCPWDVICYTKKLCTDSERSPENYWVNSSGNGVVRRMVEYTGRADVKGEMEALINGESVEKTIRQELTYQDLYASVDNIWSVLYTTGYLTQKRRIGGSRFELVIPNREVREIFAGQILELFREEVEKDGEVHRRICRALREGDISTAEECMGAYLRKTISVRDTAVRRTLRENFYHGILLAILSVEADWSVSSNPETGDGFADIIVRFNDYETAMIIEVKYADDGDMDKVCRKALEQIDGKSYAQRLIDEGFKRILKYGMAFHIKKCRIEKSDKKSDK